MNFWPLVIIAVAMMMVVGPIMMFQPSAGMRKLEKLRAEALTHKVRVKMRQTQAGESVASYHLQHQNDLPNFTLERQTMAHDVHFYTIWDWQNGKSATLGARQTTHLKRFLERLPETVVAVECQAHTVSLWWTEKQSEQWGIDELVGELKDLHKLMVEA